MQHSVSLESMTAAVEDFLGPSIVPIQAAWMIFVSRKHLYLRLKYVHSHVNYSLYTNNETVAGGYLAAFLAGVNSI